MLLYTLLEGQKFLGADISLYILKVTWNTLAVRGALGRSVWHRKRPTCEEQADTDVNKLDSGLRRCDVEVDFVISDPRGDESFPITGIDWLKFETAGSARKWQMIFNQDTQLVHAGGDEPNWSNCTCIYIILLHHPFPNQTILQIYGPSKRQGNSNIQPPTSNLNCIQIKLTPNSLLCGEACSHSMQLSINIVLLAPAPDENHTLQLTQSSATSSW